MPVLASPTPEPFSGMTSEIRIQRKNTHAFILADPTQISLTPKTEASLPSGGTQVVDGAPRTTQTFRLIPMSHTERPQRSGSAGGQQKRHDFTLLGEWDASMEPGDWWEDERGERWMVDEMVPHNGYETRGLVTAYGKTR